MTKELEALKWLNHYKNKLQNSGQTIRPNGFDIIESALKEKEEHDKILKEYGLELHDFRAACLLLAQWRGSNWNYPKIEKQLKALEIIKEKERKEHIFWILKTFPTWDDYLKHCKVGRFNPYIQKEEFDLLKEVLL